MPFISAGDGDLKSTFITDAWLIDQFVGNRLWVWGDNLNAELGDNTTISRSLPVQTIALGTNWKQVSAGYFNGAAIKTDGTLWTWGFNGNGSVGDNTTTSRSSPVQTISGGTNWKQVAVRYGIYHISAIKTDGTLWIWGQNAYGQLGDNTLTNRSSPIQTIAGGTNWLQVACGIRHTAAIKTDGTLWSWGFNPSGALGDNTTTHRSSPIQTIAGGTNWLQVSCGIGHTAAIKKDGTLWTWGSASNGQLGNLSGNCSSPVQTSTRGTNWKQVACGWWHTAAVKTDGTLWIWGANYAGAVGNNEAQNNINSPVQTISGGTNWKQVACGKNHTAAIKTDGTLWTWGGNSNGQLGDNTTTHRSSPIQILSGGTNWKQVECGLNRIAAVTYGD